MSKRIFDKLLGCLIILVWVFYIYFSILFYVQKTMNMDSAFMVFNLINYETFLIVHNRFAFVILQFLPLIFIKIGFSLKVVLYSIAIWPSLIYALISFGLYKISKTYILSLVWTFLLILPIKLFYYYAFPESILALGFSLLTFAIINKNTKTNVNNIWDLLFTIIFSLIAVFFHPFSIVFLLIILVNNYLNYGINKVFTRFLLIFLFCLFVYWIFKPTNGYDSQIYVEMMKYFYPNLLFKSYVFDFFVGKFSTYYILIYILFFINIVYFIIYKDWMKLFVYLISCFLILFICALAFYFGDDTFFMEKNMLPICLVMILPITIVFEKTYFNLFKKLSSILILIFFFTSALYQIHKVGLNFRHRTQTIIEIINDMNEIDQTKVWIHQDTYHYSKNITPWSMPYETLILSNLYLNKSISMKPFKNHQSLKDGENIFIGSDFTPNIKLNETPLNPNYFKPMIGSYYQMPYSKD